VPKDYCHPSGGDERVEQFIASVKQIGYDETISKIGIPLSRIGLDHYSYIPLKHGYEHDRDRFVTLLDYKSTFDAPDPKDYMLVNIPESLLTHYMMFVQCKQDNQACSNTWDTLGYIPVSDMFETKEEMISELCENHTNTSYELPGDRSYWEMVVKSSEEGSCRGYATVGFQTVGEDEEM
jgi:hypothetical protein